MARHKDADWEFPAQIENWQQVTVAVLMDIRDELKSLNAVLHCPNLWSIPQTLTRIERNTKPKRKRRRIARKKTP